MNRTLNKKKVKKDKSIGSIFFGLIFIATGFIKGGLAVQIPILFIVILYLIFCLVVSVIKRQWQNLLTKLIIWGIAFSLGLLGQYYLYYIWKQEANQVIMFLDHYKQESNQYPETVVFNKLVNSKLSGKYQFYYTCNERTDFYPILLSLSPNMLFDTYNYDFKDKKWHYSAD